jgi:retron-type reverse transcriptase
VVVVDIAKAFDMVPHATIFHILSNHRVYPYVTKLIENQYQDSYTTLGDGTSIAIMRGIKQGDTLSPLLFNLDLDPVLQSLNAQNEGLEISRCKLKALAFALDIAITASNREETQSMLDILANRLDVG